MCRLAYIRRPASIGRAMPGWFKHLEEVNGGHGNGVAGFINGQPRLVKGQKYDCETAAKDVQQTVWDNGCFFHTRYASAASICDANTHPFVGTSRRTGEQFLFMHNRTWPEYKKFFPLLMDNQLLTLEEAKDITDSETMSKMVELVGFMATQIADTGVWVMLDKSGATFSVRGDLEALTYYSGPNDKTGYVVCLASQFPKKFDRRFKNGERYEIRRMKHGSVGFLKNESPTVEFVVGGYEPRAKTKVEKHKVTVKMVEELPTQGLLETVEEYLVREGHGPANRECPLECGHGLQSAPLWQMLAHVNDHHAIKPKNLKDSNCPACLGDLKFTSPEEWNQHFADHVLLKPASRKKSTLERFF